MKILKVYIGYTFFQGAFGGGNQFLKALKKNLKKMCNYEKNPKKADCILFNSHHNIDDILRLKLKNQDKIFVHRIDGPIHLIRGNNRKIDKIIYKLNKIIADGTVFQSEWSRKENYKHGLKKNHFEIVIKNACDNSIFHPNEKKIDDNPIKRVKLIATSWSNNLNKGFALYKYLDENLDFNRYSMTFIGNSPIKFKNINNISPKESKDLANLLQNSHIFITGSKNDPCSNALIEALSCCLPSVALNDGGHPELIKKGGEVFNTFDECIKKVEFIRNNYELYRSNIQVQNIEQITRQYLSFFKKIETNYSNNKYEPKKLSIFDYYNLLIRYFFIKGISIKYFLVNEIKRIKSRLLEINIV